MGCRFGRLDLVFSFVRVLGPILCSYVLLVSFVRGGRGMDDGGQSGGVVRFSISVLEYAIPILCCCCGCNELT